MTIYNLDYNTEYYYPRLMKISNSTDVTQMVMSTGLGSHKVAGTVWDR